jgi:hypothetical protein
MSCHFFSVDFPSIWVAGDVSICSARNMSDMEQSSRMSVVISLHPKSYGFESHLSMDGSMSTNGFDSVHGSRAPLYHAEMFSDRKSDPPEFEHQMQHFSYATSWMNHDKSIQINTYIYIYTHTYINRLYIPHIHYTHIHYIYISIYFHHFQRLLLVTSSFFEVLKSATVTPSRWGDGGFSDIFKVLHCLQYIIYTVYLYSYIYDICRYM